MDGQTGELSKRVSSEVRAWMARRGVQQADVASVLGVSRQAVSARLNGQTQWTLDDLDAVSAFLGVSPEVLLRGPVDVD